MVALTDSSGNIVNRYSYDPYRNAISVSEQVANPFRFTGAIWDSSTGLYKMGERYYDPTVGRFTTADPIADDSTDYTYAGNNPINSTDPSGFVKSQYLGGGSARPFPGPPPEEKQHSKLVERGWEVFWQGRHQNDEIFSVQISGAYPTRVG